jgi:hypothetical protein
MAKVGRFLKYTLIGWLISIPFSIALRYIDGGKGAIYIKSHMFVAYMCVPLLIILVTSFRALYLGYKSL